jgi:CRP/FNR family transcriptional regulator
MASNLAAHDSRRGGRHDAVGGGPRRDRAVWPGIGITVTAEPGQIILVECDPIAHYYRIASGTVRIYQSIADGRRQVIDFLGAGDCFGLTGLDYHAYSVEAVSRVTMIRYPRHTVETAIRDDPGAARRLFQLACEELRRAQEHMLLLGRKTADERIASFLLRLAGADGAQAARPVVTLAMSRLDMADHLGLTIETVSRTISRFRRQGLIDLLGRQEILLRRADRLQALAEGQLALAETAQGTPGASC